MDDDVTFSQLSGPYLWRSVGYTAIKVNRKLI